MITQSNAFHKLYSNKFHFFCTTSYGKSEFIDIEQLYKCPEVFDADNFKSDKVKAIYFKVLDFKGCSTRVFAWIGFPENGDRVKVPGIVLVHGGGGMAHHGSFRCDVCNVISQ
jgi:hypothetical protein